MLKMYTSAFVEYIIAEDMFYLKMEEDSSIILQS